MNLTYYKVFDDEGFIGVATSEDLRKHQKKHNILVFAGGSDAQYITVSDELFHDKWMKEPTSDVHDWYYATVAAISLEEYETLKAAVENDAEIKMEEEEQEQTEPEIEESPEFENMEVTADYVREVKLRELSLACSKAITAGFDIEIDGEWKHFSLSANDQLNLQEASLQIIGGSTEIPYHADGDDYCLYTADVMLCIIAAANQHKTYHLAYFNCAKKWVNSLKRISSIQAVEYGTEIPAKYQSAFLKSILEG